MAGNVPGENIQEGSPSFELISRSGGLESLIRTLVSGEGIDVGDTILSYLGISREVLDEDQIAAVDTLEEAVIDGLNGRLRPGQARMLDGYIEEVKDIHCFTEPAPDEKNLQRSLENLVRMMRGLIKREGSAIGDIEAELKAVISLGSELVSSETQIAEEGSVGATTEYIESILKEKDEAKTVIMERILLAESGLFNLLKGLLATQLAKICGAKKEVFRSAEEDTLLRQLVLRVIGILCYEGENKAELIRAEISKVATAIKSEQTRSRVADVVSGTGAEPGVNLMPRGTLCPAGKQVERQMGDLAPGDTEVPGADGNRNGGKDGDEEDEQTETPDRGPTRKDLDAIEGEGEPNADDLTPPDENSEVD